MVPSTVCAIPVRSPSRLVINSMRLLLFNIQERLYYVPYIISPKVVIQKMWQVFTSDFHVMLGRVRGFKRCAINHKIFLFRLHLMPEGKHNLHLRFADEFNKLAEDFLQ